VLDAVRAAIAMPETAAGPDTFLWGHSQGGQATLFAARLAPTYAPELRVLGAAAAAPAGILAEQFDLDRDSIAGSVLGSYAVASWQEVFGYDPATVVRPLFLGRVRSAAGRCVIGGGALSDAALTADALVLEGRMWSADPATTPPWREQFEANTPTPPVAVPVLVTQGTEDQVVRPPTTARLVERFRAAGTDIEERMLPGVNHLRAGKVSAPIVARWFGRIARSA
jgi:pimeloyl-ACP methyl ester carboxylesterase